MPLQIENPRRCCGCRHAQSRKPVLIILLAIVACHRDALAAYSAACLVPRNTPSKYRYHRCNFRSDARTVEESGRANLLTRVTDDLFKRTPSALTCLKFFCDSVFQNGFICHTPAHSSGVIFTAIIGHALMIFSAASLPVKIRCAGDCYI